MFYKSVVVPQRGSPAVMQVIENELRTPKAGEVCVKVLASSVGRTDVNYRYGTSPFSPRVPFVPGYEIVGDVVSVGAGVSRVQPGRRVAALTGVGGYAEMIYLSENDLVPISAALAPEDVAMVILNYVTAYQMLQRVAHVKKGEKALIIGASGGVGTALIQLAALSGLTLYGTASPDKHALLAGYGVTPVDYHEPDLAAHLRRVAPAGFDVVFDGMGGRYNEMGWDLLKHGGRLVVYAPPNSLTSLLAGLLKLAWVNLWPNGKSSAFYGISALYGRDKKPFMQDLPLLLDLLENGKIKPVITARDRKSVV